MHQYIDINVLYTVVQSETTRRLSPPPGELVLTAYVYTRAVEGTSIHQARVYVWHTEKVLE